MPDQSDSRLGVILAFDRSFISHGFSDLKLQWIASLYAMSMNRVHAIGNLPIRIANVLDRHAEKNNEQLIEAVNAEVDPSLDDSSLGVWLDFAFQREMFDVERFPKEVKHTVPDRIIALENSTSFYFRSAFDALIDTMLIESWSAHEALEDMIKDRLKQSTEEVRRAYARRVAAIKLETRPATYAQYVRHLRLHDGSIINQKFIDRSKEIGVNIIKPIGEYLPSDAVDTQICINYCVRRSYLMLKAADALLSDQVTEGQGDK